VLQTNTELVGHSEDELVARDKMVLSCYSESGWDLWKARQEMKLEGPDDFYNKPVTYRTFFQQAVEEIG
jgi:hypothetical protein